MAQPGMNQRDAARELIRQIDICGVEHELDENVILDSLACAGLEFAANTDSNPASEEFIEGMI